MNLNVSTMCVFCTTNFFSFLVCLVCVLVETDRSNTHTSTHRQRKEHQRQLPQRKFIIWVLSFFSLKSGDGNSTHSLNSLWVATHKPVYNAAETDTCLEKKKNTYNFIFCRTTSTRVYVLDVGMCVCCGYYYCFGFHSSFRSMFVGWWQKKHCPFIVHSFAHVLVFTYIQS